MTTSISIFFKSLATLDNDSFKISIDSIPVNYQLDDSKINITSDIPFGLHELLIEPNFNIGSESVEFTNVQLNQAGLRHTLYLSYCIREGVRENTTVLSDYHQNWHLPFGNPVAWWLSECARNVRTRMYGKNLSDYYEISYPESIDIEEQFPTVVKDFFKYNFGFHSYDKELKQNPFHKMEVPFIPMPNLKYSEDALLEELTNNLNLFESSEYVPEQNNYSLNDRDGDWEQSKSVPWQILRPSLGDNRHDLSKVFPEFTRLMASLEDDGVIIGLSFIAALYPKSFVSPHIDDYYRQADFLANQKGCCKIWIPVGWKPGNYFKFEKVGLVPYDQGAYLVNPNCFTHASVNQSDTVRFTVGFNCEFPNDSFLKYL